MDPEIAALMDELARRVDEKRAAGLYAVDDMQQPSSDPREPFLAEELAHVADLAEIAPNLEGVGSTRAGVGVAVGKAKSVLARATSQPLIGVADQTTAFNSVLISYISQLAQEVAALREQVDRLSAHAPTDDPATD